MLVQAELCWQDAAANRDHLSELMDAGPSADLYVLPETFSTGFLGDVGQEPETMDGATVEWMREQAASRSAAVAGSLALVEGDERFNRFLFVTKDGILAQYDKRHLFAFGGEDQRYRAGSSRTALDWKGWRIDLQTCYDLRFPVWCRNSADHAFDLQIFVANWPTPRVEAWRSLLKARAIENQSYVIGVNRTGSDGNKVSYPGRSSAWNPMGECLSELNDQEATSLVSLDLEQLQQTRQRF
ncbi:MAG: nitrilase-related carbon-nitrogen hydrolase, partial [Wenzhouxiangella sp.]